MEVKPQPILFSALDEVNGHLHTPDSLPPREVSENYWAEG
jgi:hypothetical protein